MNEWTKRLSLRRIFEDGEMDGAAGRWEEQRNQDKVWEKLKGTEGRIRADENLCWKL